MSDSPDDGATVVACAQIAPVLGDVDANVAATSTAIERAAARGAHVVVLPELAATGYAFATPAEARAVATRDRGRSLAAWEELARRFELVVVGGFCELGDRDRLYNSAAVIDRDGLRAVYRKTHLWGHEQELFAAGEHEPPVVETSAGRLAVGICYDVYFPELVRSLAERGAELLCLPTNAPRNVPGEPAPPAAGGWLMPAQISLYVALAHLYRIFIAACDRVGDERGISWIGASAIVDETGWVLAGPPAGYREGLLVAECALAHAREKRRGPRNHVFADSRAHELLSGPDEPSRTGGA